MYNIMHNSKSGMMASQGKVDIISNNIVNSQTAGYKKLEAGFLDLYVESLNRNSYPNNSKDSITGTGVRITQEIRNLSQGFLKNTEIKTNMAIDGEGFFCVITPNGEHALTRNGEFSLDANGQMVDNYGNKLDINYVPGHEGVDLSNGDLSINKAGEIFLDNKIVGKVGLYKYQGDNDLLSVGDGLFLGREGAIQEVVEGSNILQGHIEMSNVNMQNEMTDMIMAQRAFQFNSRGMNAIDEMWSMINNLQGR